MIDIDLKSRQPIYEQIIENVIEKVITGELKADEQLSSIRQLTQQLGINPNTIQKAFAELERQGVIYSLAGRGIFISSDVNVIRNLKKDEILADIKKKIFEAKTVNIEKSEISRITDFVYDSDTVENKIQGR